MPKILHRLLFTPSPQNAALKQVRYYPSKEFDCEHFEDSRYLEYQCTFHSLS